MRNALPLRGSALRNNRQSDMTGDISWEDKPTRIFAYCSGFGCIFMVLLAQFVAYIAIGSNLNSSAYTRTMMLIIPRTNLSRSISNVSKTAIANIAVKKEKNASQQQSNKMELKGKRKTKTDINDDTYSYLEYKMKVENKSIIFHPICVELSDNDEEMCYTNLECLSLTLSNSARKYAHHHTNQQSFVYNNTKMSDVHQQTLDIRVPLHLHYSGLLYRSRGVRTRRAMTTTTCAISDKHRFIFMHLKKSGGTSVMGFLTYGLCGVLNTKKCPKQVLRLSGCGDLPRTHPDYFYFTFVRNPFDRMFSLWSHSWIRTEERAGKKQPWNQTTLTRYRLIGDFASFVQTRSKNKGFAPKGLSSDHYDPQMKWMFSKHQRRHSGNNKLSNKHKNKTMGTHPKRTHMHMHMHVDSESPKTNTRTKTVLSNCPVVDFVGHIESLDNDIWRLLHLMNNRKLIEYYISDGHSFWKVNTYGSNMKARLFDNDRHDHDAYTISNLTDVYSFAHTRFRIDVRALTVQMYKQDFELLGYDKRKIERNLKTPFVDQVATYS